MRLNFWRKCRLCFRWLRRALLVAVLAVLCVFVWFNQIGLPEFLKKPLVEKLHARGIQLEFSRLRLSLVRGLVAENVKIGDLKIAGSPSLPAMNGAGREPFTSGTDAYPRGSR